MRIELELLEAGAGPDRKRALPLAPSRVTHARSVALAGRTDRCSGDLVEPAGLHVVDEAPHLILPGDERAFTLSA